MCVGTGVGGRREGEASGKDVCGLCSSCAESDRKAKCEDLSSPAGSIAVASSDRCRKLRGVLPSCLSDRHAIQAVGGWKARLHQGMHALNMRVNVHTRAHIHCVTLRHRLNWNLVSHSFDHNKPELKKKKNHVLMGGRHFTLCQSKDSYPEYFFNLILLSTHS